jgi:hypothetical protein
MTCDALTVGVALRLPVSLIVNVPLLSNFQYPVSTSVEAWTAPERLVPQLPFTAGWLTMKIVSLKG